MPGQKILIYLLRRDLRVADNPILHALSTQKDHGFTHLLPLYIFPAQQIEVSGFIPGNEPANSPYPDARGAITNFWRCGPHRAKFMAESVWDVKNGLENLGSGLCIRVGMVGEVVREMLKVINAKNDTSVGAVWMINEVTVEEKREERDVKTVCGEEDVECKIWSDEKYLIDDRDLPFDNSKELPDVFTTYRKQVEPLRERPRPVLPLPTAGSLPSFPQADTIPAQHSPFAIPDSLEELQAALKKPLEREFIKNPPSYPKDARSAHPFLGGETRAHERLHHLLSSGAMTLYKETRNGLLDADFSSKISAWLALGCITARQVHTSMLAFEDGKPVPSSTLDTKHWSSVKGYGEGENEGTKAMRFELLWRDYMRLCARKFGSRLFHIGGFRQEPQERWAQLPRGGNDATTPQPEMIERFLNGTTGMGLIDASQREVFSTGYTSNRARQNVASFLAKHLNIDWRVGAEWYEFILVDYDVSSNWGNWQYLAGVGNDPRGEARKFNPVKQAFDYDPNGEYVRNWVEELRTEELQPKEVFQCWTVPEARRENLGLKGLTGVENPLVRINFTVGRKGRGQGRGRGSDRGDRGGSYNKHMSTNNGGGSSRGEGGGGGRGGGGGGGGGQYRGSSGYGGRGYGSSRGHLRGSGASRSSWPHQRGGGREARSGMVDKDRETVQDTT